MKAEDEGALGSGLLAIGDDVVAVLTFELADAGPGMLALVADVRASNTVPATILARSLRDVADALDSDVCHSCGEAHG